MFHVSMLQKYLWEPSHVLSYETIDVDPELSYQEQPIKILDRREKELRNKVIPLVKVLWRNHAVKEATWELEEDMRKNFPALF